MKKLNKVIVITLKFLAVSFLIFGFVASMGLSTMSMRGMMQFFVEPRFNITAFVSILFIALSASASLYGFAILIEIQDKSLTVLNEIKSAITEQTYSLITLKHDVTTICNECIETHELENDIVNAMRYAEKPDDIDDTELEILEEKDTIE